MNDFELTMPNLYSVCIWDQKYWVLAFIQFHTDNWSLEPKKTFVLLFCEQLELRQKLVQVGFLVKLTIVSFGTLRVKGLNVHLKLLSSTE